MSTPALALAGPYRAVRCATSAPGSHRRPARGDRPRSDARLSFAEPAHGWFRRFKGHRGTPVAHATNGSTGRSDYDEDAARARDAAAASGRLAPLDVKTLVGAELELIMKADPLAFERALVDQVRPFSTPETPWMPVSAPSLTVPRPTRGFLSCTRRREENRFAEDSEVDATPGSRFFEIFFFFFFSFFRRGHSKL
jgi:hypothetical protein